MSGFGLALPSAPSSIGPSPSGPPKKKKQRVKHDIVYSQPADKGTGSHLNTKFFFILDTLKKHKGPMSLSELALLTQAPLETDPDLFARFESHERVQKNNVNGLYTYRLDHENFGSRDELIKEIRTHTRKGGGLAVRTLKESWASAPSVIEDLEKEGSVLVTRAAKDGQPKMVFWNDVRANVGGKLVEEEFLTLWRELKVPAEVDLLRALEQHGLQPTTTSALPIKPLSDKKKKKGKSQRMRVGKIQNTHLNIDLTKDYVPTPGGASIKPS